MSDRPDDWDELFLRYLEGEADPDLERRVRERLMSDESARARLVDLACRQQALADVLGETAARKPSSRRLMLPRPAPRSGLGFLLAAAAAAAVALAGFLLLRSDPVPEARRKPTPPVREERESESPRPPIDRPQSLPEKPAPSPSPDPAPKLPPREEKPPVDPAPAPKPEDPAPAPKVEEPKPAPAKTETAPKPATETVVATVERVDGGAWLIAAQRTKIEGKQSILAGYGLEVAGPAGEVEISYADGTRVKLGPETSVREFLEPKGRVGKRLFLAQGVLTADVRKQPAEQPMTIATPQGEAVVVGTKLRLSVEPGEKGTTKLEVEEGKVRLKRLVDGKTVDVATGHFAVAGAATAELKSLPSILSGLVGYWRFEDPAGTTMTDSSGQGNDGTLAGKARRTLGKFGQALEFDGATSSVQIPHAASLNPGTSNFSISLWLRSRKQDVWPWDAIFKDNGKFQHYYYLAIGGKPRFEFATGDAKVVVDGQAGVNDNRWHHLAAIRNGPYSAQLWVDGVLDSSGSSAPSANSSINTNSPLIIGAGNQTFYAGLIDDVRFYNRALTADEVRQLFSGR